MEPTINEHGEITIAPKTKYTSSLHSEHTERSSTGISVMVTKIAIYTYKEYTIGLIRFHSIIFPFNF
jgi:hypothetical protein